ncbi:MAG: hypothetical protein ACOX3Q_08735 [Clostridia bacterium]|jgi:hypothetical protein|nr:DUF4358 domain-containing protein [Clostridiaceae bacterium]
MKKLILVLIALSVAFSFVACKSENTEPSGLEGSLEDILDKIYETAELDDSFKRFVEEGLMVQEITEENIKYHLGVEEMEYEEAIASEPIMQPGAYSLCLVRAKEGADIEQMKADIKKNVDPRKWICVGVDEENVIVDNIGDVIFLVMSNTNAQELHQAFLALKD